MEHDKKMRLFTLIELISSKTSDPEILDLLIEATKIIGETSEPEINF